MKSEETTANLRLCSKELSSSELLTTEEQVIGTLLKYYKELKQKLYTVYQALRSTVYQYTLSIFSQINTS